jgi:hypothetical protein
MIQKIRANSRLRPRGVIYILFALKKILTLEN